MRYAGSAATTPIVRGWPMMTKRTGSWKRKKPGPVVPGLFLRMRFVSPDSLHLGWVAVLIIASIEFARSILMGSGGFGELGSILSFIMQLNATRPGLTNGLMSVSCEIEPRDQDAPALSYCLAARLLWSRAGINEQTHQP